EAGGPGLDRHAQTAAHKGRVTAGPVDGVRDQAELVVEPGLVGLHLRNDILREELERQPPESADEPDPPALPLRSRDGGAPVGLDAELVCGQTEAMAAGDEGDRHALQPPGARLEHRLRLVRGEPADVDARDPSSARQMLRRAGKDERQHDDQPYEQEADDADLGPRATPRWRTARNGR